MPDLTDDDRPKLTDDVPRFYEAVNNIAVRLANMPIPSMEHMAPAIEHPERFDGIRQMLHELNDLARKDGCIAAAWALDVIDYLSLEPVLTAGLRAEVERLKAEAIADQKRANEHAESIMAEWTAAYGRVEAENKKLRQRLAELEAAGLKLANDHDELTNYLNDFYVDKYGSPAAADRSVFAPPPRTT